MSLILYYSPGSCGLTAHILLNELGWDYKLEKVDLAKKVTSLGEDYGKINPKGYVPALKLENGTVLTEGLAIAQYLAELKPASGLLPAVGQMERYEVLSWFHFVATELHKNFSPLFYKTTSPEHKQFARDLLTKRLAYTSEALGTRHHLVGSQLTMADVYLYNVLRWCPLVEINLGQWSNLQNWAAGIDARPTVRKALTEQGIPGIS